MRKTILVLVCIFNVVIYSQAQTDSKQPNDKKVSLGIRTGYEFQSSDSNLDYKLNVPYIGMFSNIGLSEKWSLQLELNFRSEKREELFLNEFKQTYNEVYLTIPILLKYHIKDKFKIYTGTQVLSASLKNDIFGVKKWNGILGVEYDLAKNFFLDVRFRHGFEGRKSTNNFRDNRISLGIAYKF